MSNVINRQGNSATGRPEMKRGVMRGYPGEVFKTIMI